MTLLDLIKYLSVIALVLFILKQGMEIIYFWVGSDYDDGAK